MRYLVFAVTFFIAFSAQARILFQDPTGKALDAEYDNFSESEIKNISPPDETKKKYLLGLLYLNGDVDFNIEKNCSKSVSLLEAAWGANIVDAGQALSTMYYHGVCVQKNINKAKDLATQTAEEGFILSQRMLGMSYLGKNWKGLYPYNVDKGIYWLSKAGKAGNRESSAYLASMYNEGIGVPKNEKKYFQWLREAIFNRFEKSNMLGFPVLAECYENGKGTKVNLIKAYKYYDLSGSAGIEGKQRIAKDMTQEQIDEATQQSQAWQKEHNVQVGGGFIRRVD